MEKTELVVQFAHILNLIAVNLFRLTRLGIFVRHQTSIIINLRFAVSDDCFAIGGLTAWFEEQPTTVNSAAAVKIEVIRICFCMVFSLLFSCFQ